MKRWIALILILGLTVWASMVSGSTYNPVSPSNDLKYPKAFVMYSRGTDGLYYDTGTLPVSGSFSISSWPSFFTDRNSYDTQLQQLKFDGDYLEVVQKDTGINDAGGSLTVDNTYLDTSLTVILSKINDLKLQLDKLKFATDDLKVVFSNSWPSFFTDRLVYDTQLQQFKFATNDLKVVFSNTSIGAAVSNWPASFGAAVSNWPSGFNVNNWPSSYTVSGTVGLSSNTVVDTGALTDTIQMDSGAINPYSEITKTYTNVKWIQAKARTGIDVRVSTGTGSSTSTTYDIISAGERWRLSNLHAIASLVVKFMGNSATSSDTGIIQITVGN